MQSDQGNLEDNLRKLEDEKELKRRVILDLEKQIFDQKEKLLRANKSLKKLYKDIQRMCENSHNVILMQEVILFYKKKIFIHLKILKQSIFKVSFKFLLPHEIFIGG